MLKRAMLSVVCLAVTLGGCFYDRGKGVAAHDPLKGLPPGTRLDPSQEALAQARSHFRNEDYGLAEKYYRKAVEQNPHDADAWVGLAATYDRLRRFDLAERAYQVVVQKVGYTLSVHNNLGYHHYLRGNLSQARKHFDAAQQMDPSNPYVLNNLKLVEPS